jgi:endonuclease/exonuclease/phosphatase family metal-dependent hydrolase
MKSFILAKKAIRRTRGSIAWLFGFHPRSNRPETRKEVPADPVFASGLSLNVMSFNIRRGTKRDGKNHWVYRSSLVHEILDQYRPDVLGLQEAVDFQVSEIRAMLPGYEMVGNGNLGGSEGMHNAIFYDASRFVLAEEGTFGLSDAPDIPGSKGWGNIIPRICTWARLVEKESRQAFYFYNTHLDHISLRSRKKSVILLTQRIEARTYQDPFVLTGDFNAGERSAPIRYLKGTIPLRAKSRLKVSNPLPLRDTFRVRYPNFRKTATFHGFGRYFFRFRLDYIFVPASIRVIDTKIIQRRWKKCYPSDHFPLLAHIDLPVAAACEAAALFEAAVNQ